MTASAQNLSTAPTQVTYTSWAVYWDELNVNPAIDRYTTALDEICTFAYQFGADGRLIPASTNLDLLRGRVQTQASQSQTKHVITVVNDVRTPDGNKLKDSAIVHRAIGTSKARAAHIKELMRLVEGPIAGLDIDYEKVAFEDAAAFQLFVQDLSRALREKQKWLSVVVQPRTSESVTPSMKKNGVATIDWKAIAPFVDRVKVMAYLFSFPSSAPGSVAPTSWVDQVASYGLRQVPGEKLSIILHLGGFDWPVGKPGRSIEYPQAKALALAHKTALMHDSRVGASHFTYVDGSLSHDVWVEDAAGLTQKVERLKSLGVRSIGFWRLGSGDPSFWDQLAPGPSPSDPIQL
jgi:spore germination protein YaaH